MNREQSRNRQWSATEAIPVAKRNPSVQGSGACLFEALASLLNLLVRSSFIIKN
ncbi:hypothetical protein [Fodinibius halophilus]|uniref:Uncharacterized protein n=1 Tax=Fodinibius halophilus TaxID=1736908 RepID=A0A6M1T1L4_9BACT|nr:hypothetical protein [Fodinibius halophilus]NGP89376.1 hypothetical protein [Fodinibius halophilus]